MTERRREMNRKTQREWEWVTGLVERHKVRKQLRAPKIAIANRRDFLSQTSPLPAEPQWGRFSSKNRKKNRNRLRFSVTRKIARYFWASKSLRFFHLRQKIAIAIAEKSRHLVQSTRKERERERERAEKRKESDLRERQDVGKGGLSLRGSRHDQNHHNHQNHQNCQNRHGCPFVLYFVAQAKEGQGAFQNRRNCQNRQNRHEGYPP